MMPSIFPWFDKIFEWIWSMKPAFRIVPYTRAGIAFKRGKHPVPVMPGLFWYWPFWTEVVTFPTNLQTVNLPSQSLRGMGLRAVVRYRVKDAFIALQKCYDIDEMVRDMGLASVKEVLSKYTSVNMQGNSQEIDAKLKEDLSKKLRGLGLEVKDMFLSDMSECIVVKMLGDERTEYPFGDEEGAE